MIFFKLSLLLMVFILKFKKINMKKSLKCFPDACHNRTVYDFKCLDFKRFEDMIFPCNITTIEYLNDFYFLPKTKIVFKDFPDISSWFIKTQNMIFFNLVNIKGFDMDIPKKKYMRNFSIFLDKHYKKEFNILRYLKLKTCDFRFFINGKNIDNNEKFCNQSEISQGYFSTKYLDALEMYQSVRYPDLVCPLVFKDTKLLKLYLFQQVKSFIKTNRLKFRNLILKNTSLNSKMFS